MTRDGDGAGHPGTVVLPGRERDMYPTDAHIAVLIPCYNESRTIGRVIAAFRAALPGAEIVVCDNNSSDATARLARDHGARVLRERQQGKGHAVRRLFCDVEADIYIMVDGDATYDAGSAPRLVRRLCDDGLAMVTGARVSHAKAAYRHGHQFGNWLLTALVRWSFGDRFRDMLSGYRVMSRRFVKSFPALSDGFEIETELSVHALQLRLPTDEVDTPYLARPDGSESKLNTLRDGFRILRTIGRMVRDGRPLQFFSVLAGLMLLAAAGLCVPIGLTYVETGLVPRLPTLIAAIGLSLTGILALAVGLILDTLSRLRVEARRLAYLATPVLSQRAGGLTAARPSARG